MKRKWLLLVPILLVALVPILSPAQRPAEPATVPAPIEVYFSPKGGCTDAIVREVKTARSSIRMQAYSFTSTDIAKALIDAKKRGVKVEALLDKSNRTAQYSSATFLLNQGCDVRIDAKHAIAHNKIILVDDRTVITGSFNFTKAAEENNAENLLVIRDNPKLMERYQANFREHQSHSETYTGPAKAEATAAPEAEPAHQGKYVGSKGSAVYHLPGCKDVERISPSNRVEYDEPPQGKRLHRGCPR